MTESQFLIYQFQLSENNWGAKVIDQLAKGLCSEFQEIKSFSRINLYHVKKYYEFFCSFSDQEQFVPRSGGQIESAFVPRGEAQMGESNGE